MLQILLVVLCHTDIHSFVTDHSKSVADIKKMGIPVWQPYLDGFDINMVQKRGYGNFKIMSFELPHNGTDNCGFLI